MDHRLAKGIAKAGVNEAQRHLFVCIGPDCCHRREGEALWDVIKARTKKSRVPVMRTKAACLRICTEGPWLVVYPEGVWYSRVTPERFERIFSEHVEGGRPVEEWIVVRNDLGATPAPPPRE